MPILAELTRGTSYTQATDTWDETEERWRICFEYAWPEEDYSVWREWCTWADAPEPPPPPPPPPVVHCFPWCPPPCWPDLPWLGWAVLTGSVLEWLLTEPDFYTWLDLIGPYGGWTAGWESPSGAFWTVTYYPTGPTSGGMNWRIAIVTPDWSQNFDVDVPCDSTFVTTGFFPCPAGEGAGDLLEVHFGRP